MARYKDAQGNITEVENAEMNPALIAGKTLVPDSSTIQSQDVNPNRSFQESIQSPSDMTGQERSTSPKLQVPDVSLQPGATGQDVKKLQDYLVQMEYLTPEQEAGSPGVYGSETTSAVTKLQKDLGIQAGTGSGFYGPKTKTALKDKYNSYFKSVKDSQTPQTPSQGSQAVQTGLSAYSQQSTDPVFNSMAGVMQPIMQSLGRVLQNINNPALTTVSLQQEYNDLAAKSNLPEMNARLMNMQNVMNGTTDDIRNEISKVGGFATESQVLALSAARNNVILKQYNALATQYQAAQQNVQNMMQYETTDQATQLQRQKMTASITESMASIGTQVMQMGMTMQNHATDSLNKVVTNIGYTGLAAQAKEDPITLRYYENLLGLSHGSLSDPVVLRQMETYRQRQLQLGQQKIVIQQSGQSSLTDYRKVMEMSRYSTIANNTIRQMYQSNKNPIQIYNSSAPILSRIDAALPLALDPKNKDKTAPDLDLVDAYVQIARGGQQITEAQVETLLGGLGIPAKWDVATQKVIGTGILNNGTRNSLARLSKDIVSNQKKQANLATEQINSRLSSITGFPSDMLLQSPADIQLYTDSAVGSGARSTFTSDNGQSYVLPY